MLKKKTNRAIMILASLLLCFVLVFGMSASIMKVFAAENSNYDTDNVLYLSDTSRIQHATGKASDNKTAMSTAYNNKIYMKPSYTGTDLPGGAIQAKIENAWYTFDYGIYVHGAGYVAFNISDFTSKGYKYFSVYVGLLPAASKSDGSWIYVQTSEDGKNVKGWDTRKDGMPVEPVGSKYLISYNQNFIQITLDVENVKWIRLCADASNAESKDAKGNAIKYSNAQDYVCWADAKLSKTLDAGEEVPPISVLDSKIKEEVTKGKDIADPTLELLVLQRELISRVGQYALKRFLGENEDNKAMWNWLFYDLASLREFMMGGTPFKGNYFESLTVLSGLYKRYKNDLTVKDKLKNNTITPDRTFGELCRTMMFSVALTHDGPIGSYLQGSKPENASDPYRRYAIFKYMYQTERFVALRNADGSWKSETMTMFGNMEVEEMRWLMCNIIDDESIIWLNDYVQTRINNAKNVGSLYTPHSYVRYTDPNYGNPVFYAEANKDYFNSLFSVDSREFKDSNGNVIVKDDNYGAVLSDELVKENSAHKDTSIKHYGLWDCEYHVPAGEGEPDYVIKVSRSGEGEAHIQKVWMNFNNKFKTGSVCGGISKSGNNIRTSRGIPANVIGQPGHAAILYYSMDANGNGNWKIDNDVGGWLAATKGERHLLGWGNEAWQRNSGGTVVYFHLAQACLNDYDKFVRAEEYCWLAKVYAGDLTKREELYGRALAVQSMNLDAWYGLTTTFMANENKTATNFCSLVNRIADTLWNHPVAMHCLFRVLNAAENPKPEATKTQRSDAIFVSQLRTAEVNALAKAKASGSAAAKSKVNYFLGNTDTSVADFSFDGENAGCIVWSDTYKGSGFRWRYSLDGKKTWSDEIVFTGEEAAPIHKLPEAQINAISSDNDIYVYIVGADPNSAYKIEVSAKPALPDVVYANDWENRIIGVNGTYEWRYCESKTVDTEMGSDTTYTPVSNWRSFADATPDCTGDVAVEVRVKGTSKNPASDSKIFTFTEDDDDPTKKYISVDYLNVTGYSTQSQDANRPNYAENAIDGNANTYWHTDYAISIKEVKYPDANKEGTPLPYAPAYLTIKLDAPTWLSALEFSQRQYNSSFSIFAKKVTVYVSETGKDGSWTKAGERADLENIADLNVVNFNASTYCQYVKLEMTELYETNKNDGVFTTVSLINLYEDTTKTTPTLTATKPIKDGMAGFGDVITKEVASQDTLVADEAFKGHEATNASAATFATKHEDVVAAYSNENGKEIESFNAIFQDKPGEVSNEISSDVFENIPGYNPDNITTDILGNPPGDTLGNGKKKSNAGLVVALVIVAVVLIGAAGVGVFFFMKRKQATAGGAAKESKPKKTVTKAPAQKAAKPAATTAAKPAATTTAAKPAATTATKPAATTATKPAATTAAKPAATTAAKPAATTAAKPAATTAAKPAATTAAKPAATTAAKPAATTAAKPAATTAAKPAATTAAKPAATTAPKSTSKPTVIDGKPTAKPATKPKK